MSNQNSSYLRKDLTILLVLVLIIGAVVGGLWYWESQGNGFSTTTRHLLDFTGK